MKAVVRARKQNSGFSLIEIIISIAIFSLLSLGVAQIMATQSQEIKALNERLVLTDLKTRLTSLIGKQDLCSCLLKTNRFNTRRLASPLNTPISHIPETYNFPLPTGPAPCNERNIPNLVPQADRKLPGSHIKVESIGAITFVDMGAGSFLGELEVKLKNEGTVRQLKPVLVPFMVNVDTSSGTAQSRPISTCGPATGGSQQMLAFYEPTAIELNQTVFPNRRVACAGSQIVVEFGGSFSNDNPYDGRNHEDSRGHLRLYINNVEVAERKGGGRVGRGGDMTDSPTTVHAMWTGPCTGSAVVRVRWETEDRSPPSSRPIIEFNYLKIGFFEP